MGLTVDPRPLRVSAAGVAPSLMRAGDMVSPSLPDGMRIYAIGDIHGELGKLKELYRGIEQDRHRGNASEIIEIFLGDYVDRGPDSRGVIDFLCDVPPGVHRVFLKGNHEEMMLQFLDDPQAYGFWGNNGGDQTLYSYGVDVPTYLLNGDLGGLHAELLDALDGTHSSFLADLSISAAYGDYFFVHAGVRPSVALEDQSVDDCLWIRDRFLTSNADWGKIIVHGHTPRAHVEVMRNRIGIDTGAVFGGPLSCLVLEGDEQLLMQAGA